MTKPKVRFMDHAGVSYPELRNAGYRVIHLNRHRYFFVYQMKDADTVYIAAMYHDLQDYEALFKSENLNR